MVKLQEDFASTFKICEGDLNKLVLFLKGGVHPSIFMYNGHKINVSYLPNNEKLYSNLSIENISENDSEHSKNMWNTFKIKKLGDYHDLHVQADTFLLTKHF